jgi:glyoxylase-like metal-dependent hydrolase (beta-lactamase superfamily II)
MKVIQHGDNLWQLTRLWFFNCYLVREANGLTLIDTGMPGSGTGILQAAAAIGLPITRITLTHAHGDHAGSIDEVRPATAEAEVLYTERSAALLQGNLDRLPDEPQAPLRGTFYPRTTQPTGIIAPGDLLGSLRVVAAAGHTPDHVAFFDERDGTLIAGDAFQTAAGIAVSGIRRWLFPFPAMATWHLPTALQSARVLAALKPTRLAVGHGRVLDKPDDAIAAAIREAEVALDGQATKA